MAYVPPEYPGEIPEFAEIWPPVDDVNWMFTAAWDAMVKELRAALIELGTLPKGSFADVKTRLEEGGPLSKCKAYLNSEQDILKDAWTKVLLDGEVYDGQNEYDPVTNHRFTATKAGYYQINGSIRLKETQANGDGLWVAIRVNGASRSGAVIRHSTGTYSSVGCADILYLAAEDYIELFVLQEYTENRLLALSAADTYMSIHKLS